MPLTGVAYAIMVRATSGDRTRDVAEMLSFATAAAGGGASNPVSASARLRQPIGQLAFAGNNFDTYRYADRAVVSAMQVRPVFAQE